MHLFKIERSDECDYDEYSDAVVAAESEDEARLIHPSGGYYVWKATPDHIDKDYHGEYCWISDGGSPDYGSWIKPDKVIVKHIGIAAGDIERGVICASFHAG